MSDDTKNQESQVFVSDYQKSLISQWEKDHATIDIDEDGKENRTCPPAPMQVTGNQVRWINRKERRAAMALKRKSNNKPKYDIQRAILGYIKGTMESPRTQQAILSGKLDAWLPQPQQENNAQVPENKQENTNALNSSEQT